MNGKPSESRATKSGPPQSRTPQPNKRQSSSAVRPKKALGQHFLTDQTVARSIVATLRSHGPVLEVGPGTGVLTQYLLQDPSVELKVVEIDSESVRYLLEHFPRLSPSLYEADFLRLDLARLFPDSFALIGNFPYNISSQIFFKVLDYRGQISEVVCMIQKEVADRLAAPPGSKTYGILSVLLQAWYDIEYCFTVGEGAFLPPPKVKSAVIRLTRNGRTSLDCDEELFKTVVKTTFNQRRKTIRNSLKPILAARFPSGRSGFSGTSGSSDSSDSSSSSGPSALPAYIPYLDAPPEQLSVEEFVELTRALKGE